MPAPITVRGPYADRVRRNDEKAAGSAAWALVRRERPDVTSEASVA